MSCMAEIRIRNLLEELHKMRLSIITINRNNAEGLRKTIESIFAQTNRDFEYIIVDGASFDGSVEIIKEFAQTLENGEWRLENFMWSSEPDTGIYNAMNKGLKKAHGEYTLMLNSGDYLVDEYVVERVLSQLDGTDIIQGNVISTCAGKETLNRGYGKSDITFIDVMKGHFLHQASFCRRELFGKYGYFDESYKINGDTVFYAKCLGFGDATFKYVNLNIAYYDMSGISADPNGRWVALRKEEDEWYAQLFSKRMWDLYYKEERKIKLYDKLHKHKWSWNLTMLISKMIK